MEGVLARSVGYRRPRKPPFIPLSHRQTLTVQMFEESQNVFPGTPEQIPDMADRRRPLAEKASDSRNELLIVRFPENHVLGNLGQNPGFQGKRKQLGPQILPALLYRGR